ncbi:hypothetical protein FACS1894186_6750 [Alphaproteobacteria bacterium]|nr:hypothetical protein FACS1894186_6750 [Alphaproteobacteria bacterium]
MPRKQNKIKLLIGMLAVALAALIAVSALRAPEADAPAAQGQASAYGAEVAENTAILYFLPTCPHCHDAMAFIDGTLAKEPAFAGMRVVKLDVGTLKGDELQKFKDLGTNAVPALVLGEEVVIGFDTPEGVGEKYRALLARTVPEAAAPEPTPAATAAEVTKAPAPAAKKAPTAGAKK